MKQDDLNKIEGEYTKINRLRTIARLLKEEKEELEQEQMVKRYLEVNEKLSKMSMYLNFSDHYIMSTALKQVNITDTNNIFVCLGTYKRVSDIAMVNFSHYALTSHDDDQAEYSEYVDLEKDIAESFKVDIKDREVFEKNNSVIYLNPVNISEFYELQHEFFRSVIENGQEQTVNTIKKQLVK